MIITSDMLERFVLMELFRESRYFIVRFGLKATVTAHAYA